MRTFWVLDLETLTTCFVAVFEAYDREERKVFIINRDRNDIVLLIDFLLQNQTDNDWHLGYNLISFDTQIIEYIIKSRNKLILLDSNALTKVFSDYAQKIIEKTRKKEYLDFAPFKFKIPVIDIYKLNHWDSPSKRSSLKWIQYAMDWENVQEMPYDYTEVIDTQEKLDIVVAYCINDVRSTKAIFNYKNSEGKMIMREQVRLRGELSNKYDINLFSASEPKISKEIFLHFLSEKLGKEKADIRNLRTSRPLVDIGEIILPYIHFDTPEFKAVHNWYKNLVIDIKETDTEDLDKKGPKYTMLYKNVPTIYGLGGIHGCNKPGIYQSKDGKVIMSVDVTSFYPFLAINNKWSPAHIPGVVFNILYRWFFDERIKHPKGSNLNYLFKIILNATYGLSKSIHSFLYDPLFTFRITVNGQLLLSMFYEKVMLAIPNAIMITMNTDGVEFLIDEKDKEKFMTLKTEWEALTGLQLEKEQYKKMIVSDVNNYIAVYEKEGKEPKCKGRFEFKDLPLHKNKSFLVIPKAIYEYFIHGIKPQQYLSMNTNIFDYCAGVKVKGDWSFEKREIKEGTYVTTKLHKLIRYYISPDGCKIIKCNIDGREIQVEAQGMQTLFNQYKKLSWKDYNIDTTFYLNGIYREIDKIEQEHKETINPQLSLFF